MSEKQSIIFDWGGVFARTEDYSYRHRWDDQLNRPHGTVESVVHGIPEWTALQHGTLSTDVYLSAIAKALDIDEERTHQILDDFYKGDVLDSSLLVLVDDLRKRDVKVGLLSNNVKELHNELESLGLTGRFDAIVISADIGVMKPKPEAYLTALTALSVSTEESLFIDDSAENIKGALAVGMQGILFTPEIDLSVHIEGWLHGRS